MSDEATPIAGAEPAAAGTQETQGAQAPFDIAQFESMLDSKFAQQDERLSGFEQRLPQPPEPEPEPEMDPWGQLQQAGYQDDEVAQLQGLFNPVVQQAIQQATAPLMQQIQSLQQGYAALNNELDAGDLVERYPALGTDEVWTPVAAEAVELAQSLGLQVQRPEEVPTKIIESAYLARLGRERVASETPAGGANPGLESASGAAPQAEEPDLATQIVNARRGPKTPGSNFWGWGG